MSDNINTLSATKILAYTFAFFCIAVVIIVSFQEYKNKPEYKSEEWIKVGENDTGEILYDRESMVRRQDGTVTVQVKHIISFETYKVMVSVLPGLAGVLYISFLDTFDCSSWDISH